MDWQVARQLEIRVQDAVMQVGFTEQRCLGCDIGVVGSKVAVI